MATLGPNDLKQIALPTNWDPAVVRQRQLASGENYEELIADITTALANQNAALLEDMLYGGLVYPTEIDVMEYAIGVSNGFEEVTEYSRPDAKRAATVGHILPLKRYDRGFGWTDIFLEDARRAQIDADVSAGMAAVRDDFRKLILTRHFKSTADTVGSGKSVPYADGGTADSAYIPINNPERASAFAYTHNHFGRLDGISQANLETGVTHIWEHGFDGPYELLIAEADIASWVDVTAITGYVKTASELIQYGSQTDLARAAGYIGVVETQHGTCRLRASARIPTKYWSVYKSYGNQDARNPLALRYNPARGIGAVLLAGDHIREYPLEYAFLRMQMGVGVSNRVAAYCCYNYTTGSYVVPTIV